MAPSPLLFPDNTNSAILAAVSAANAGLRGGAGLDGQFHPAAGPGLARELVQSFPAGGITAGAYETGSHNIQPTNHIIHAVGPDYRAVRSTAQISNAEGNLAVTYRDILKATIRIGARTVPIPTISTGIFAFPRVRAARIALATVRD